MISVALFMLGCAFAVLFVGSLVYEWWQDHKKL